MQVLDGHSLPHPLSFTLPTVIAHLDTPAALADVRDARLRPLLPTTPVTRLVEVGGTGGAGGACPSISTRARRGADVPLPGPGAPGLAGAVPTMARLRQECPWDAEQTHHSLTRHLVEEAFEGGRRGPASRRRRRAGLGGYVEVEEELGDVLLQVLFHAVIASEVGAFDVDEVAASSVASWSVAIPTSSGTSTWPRADEVRVNWDRIKSEEKGRESLLDGVPVDLPALSRAHASAPGAHGRLRLGLAWTVVAKVREELAEVLAEGAQQADELGDLLFSVVNLSRHLEVDPELALRAAARSASSAGSGPWRRRVRLVRAHSRRARRPLGGGQGRRSRSWRFGE